MKKIIVLLLVFSIMSFSDCKYSSELDSDIKALIQVIKSEGLESKLYCDENGEKMIYYLNSEVNFGFVYKVKNINTLSMGGTEEVVARFFIDIMKVSKNKNMSSKKFDKEVYARMYIEDEYASKMLTVISFTSLREMKAYKNTELSDLYYEDDSFYLID